MSRPIAVALVVALGVASVTLGCADESTTPTPTPSPTPAGTLHVTLTTPNSGLDGATVVVLTGPAAPRAVTAASGLVLWGGPVHTAQATVAVTGVLNAGTILNIEVEDVALVGQYSATLREVSAGDATVALRSLAGYSLTVAR